MNGMELLRGRGNLFDRSGAASEDDKVNRIWVMDSSKYDFHPAEVYHQFHNGLGKAFPPVSRQPAPRNSGRVKPPSIPAPEYDLWFCYY